MKPRITVITLGVDDLEKSLVFYRNGLGLPTQGIIGKEFEHGAVAFFDLQNGVKLALWPRKSIAHDSGVPLQQPNSTDLTIGHNVNSKKEVDEVMRLAEKAGAKIIKPAADTFWGGYAGYFQDPDGHLWEVVWNPAWNANKFPAHLYKYMEIPKSKDVNFLNGCLTSLKFSSPKALNDPFDMKINLNFAGTNDDEWREFHRQNIKHGLAIHAKPAPSHSELEERVGKEMAKFSSNEERQKDFVSEADEISNEFGVACLSEDKSDILMWSHYADKHSGFCLEFDFQILKSSSKENRWDIVPVYYSETNEFRAFNDLAERSIQGISKIVLNSKSAHWAYEKEWRIIQAIDGSPKCHSLPPKALTGIIFGLKMPPEDRNKIRAEANKLGDAITMYEAIRSSTKYEMKIRELETWSSPA